MSHLANSTLFFPYQNPLRNICIFIFDYIVMPDSSLRSIITAFSLSFTKADKFSKYKLHAAPVCYI